MSLAAGGGASVVPVQSRRIAQRPKGQVFRLGLAYRDHIALNTAVLTWSCERNEALARWSMLAMQQKGQVQPGRRFRSDAFGFGGRIRLHDLRHTRNMGLAGPNCYCLRTTCQRLCHGDCTRAEIGRFRLAPHAVLCAALRTRHPPPITPRAAPDRAVGRDRRACPSG